MCPHRKIDTFVYDTPIARPVVESFLTMPWCVRASIVSCSGARGVRLEWVVSFYFCDAGKSTPCLVGPIECAMDRNRRPCRRSTASDFSAVGPGRCSARPLLQGRFNQPDFVLGRRVQVVSQRKTLAVCHHHPLRTLSTFGCTHAVPPFLAGAKRPSAKVSAQSSWPSNARHAFSQRPCFNVSSG